MKIILSKHCESFSGSIGHGFGYFIQARRTKSGMVNYFSQRSKHYVPPDGHWRFIVACAELAQIGLHIADIQISQKEIMKALSEMKKGNYFWTRSYPEILNAANILTLKERLSL